MPQPSPTPFTEKEIAQFRAETPATKNLIHLNNAGAALMPQSVSQAIKDHIDLENQMGGYEAANHKADAAAAFYQACAKMLHTHPRNIAYQTSATDAYNHALSSIPFTKGDWILTTNDDYVSNQIAFLQLEDRFGIRLARAADLPEGGVDLDDLQKLMDQYRPKVVAITHIPTNSGLVQPVAAIGALCRERDLIYIVDACQSAGQMPLDVNQMHCDFLSVTMRKFLRGPRGSGFLYVSDRILQKAYSPLLLDLHSARWSAINSYTPVADAKRFELWERSHALLLGASTAIEYANTIGLDRIETRVVQLSQYLRDQLQLLDGVSVLDQGPQLAGIVSVAFDRLSPKELQIFLQTNHINSSVIYFEYARIDLARKGVQQTLRLSPHYYNTFEELDQCISTIKQAINTP